MSVSFSVKGDVERVMRSLNDMQRKEIPGAVSAALNRAITRTHTQVIREVAAEVKAPQKVVRKRVLFQKRDRASARNWVAGVWAATSALPAALVGTVRAKSQKGIPIRARSKTIRVGKYNFPGAFIINWPKSGKLGIYHRTGKPRYPVKEERIPIADAVNRIATRAIEQTGLPEFSRRLDHELNFRLQKKGLM